jgi:predicted nucleic acid-binding Zn ribbon protein
MMMFERRERMMMMIMMLMIGLIVESYDEYD